MLCRYLIFVYTRLNKYMMMVETSQNKERERRGGEEKKEGFVFYRRLHKYMMVDTSHNEERERGGKGGGERG